jgi:hypothetical protein
MRRKSVREPVSAGLLAQLKPAGEFVAADTHQIYETRPCREPYWTAKGLVLTEGRWTVSYWDDKTRSRQRELVGRYRPNVISGPWIEELRAKELAAKARAKRKSARVKSSANNKSKKGRTR